MELASGRTVSGSAWEVLRDHLLYLAVVAAYSLPYLFERDLFFRDESRYGGVVEEMIRNDAWFTLTNGGTFYSDKPPLFFTLLRLATEIAGTTTPVVFFAVVALSAFFFVAASDAFLRAAGFDRPTIRAGNLLLLAVPWIAIHMQTVRMDLLFSGLILLSATAYVRGAARAEANLLPLVGGLLAGLAVLTKGPFGALIPLFGVAAFLVAMRRARLLIRADLAWSLVPLIAPSALWLVSIHATFGDLIFEAIFGEQIVERAVAGRDSSRAWWLYPLWLALTLMPWLLIAPLFVAEKFRRLVFGADDWKRPQPGFRLVAPFAAAAIVILGLVAQKNIQYLLPVVPGLMAFVAVAYRRLDAEAPRFLDWCYVALAATALIAAPATALALDFLPEKERADIAVYVRLETLAHAAAILALAAIPIAAAARLRGNARLLAGVVATAILVTGVKAIALPDLDRTLSPRHVVALFESKVPAGQPILVYGIYRGALTYHFDNPLIYIESAAEMRERLGEATGPVYVIMTNSGRTRDASLWAGFTRLAETRLERTQLFLYGRAEGGSGQAR